MPMKVENNGEGTVFPDAETVNFKSSLRADAFIGWPQKRPAIYRLSVIHDALVRSQGFKDRSLHPVNAGVLAELLEVSRKTVARDFDFLRDQLRLPIEYDPVAHSFVYQESVTQSFMDYLNGVRGRMERKEAA
jgi:hypothetical protein